VGPSDGSGTVPEVIRRVRTRCTLNR